MIIVLPIIIVEVVTSNLLVIQACGYVKAFESLGEELGNQKLPRL